MVNSQGPSVELWLRPDPHFLVLLPETFSLMPLWKGRAVSAPWVVPLCQLLFISTSLPTKTILFMYGWDLDSPACGRNKGDMGMCDPPVHLVLEVSSKEEHLLSVVQEPGNRFS